MTARQTQNGSAIQAVPQKAKITTQVLSELQRLQKTGKLDLPPHYSAANALNSAYLALQDTKTRSDQPVLETCTQASIARALCNMAYLGLNPSKKQCYFIAYGNDLSLFVSYFGNMAIAKRVDPSIKDITAQVIYKGDKVGTSIIDGKARVTTHEHQFGTENPANLVGAYCNVIHMDGSYESTVMNMDQIRKCWQRGQAKGNSSAHRDTPDQMAMRTVINRACKMIINTSDDRTILTDVLREIEMEGAEAETTQTVRENTNVIDVDFEPVRQEAPAPAMVPEPEPKPEDIDALTVDPETGDIVSAPAAEPAPPAHEPAAMEDAKLPF